MGEPHPMRRSDDENGGFVVSLREYLETKIKAGHEKVHGEIELLRSEVAAGQLQSTREHAAVQHELGELKAAVAALAPLDDVGELKAKVALLTTAETREAGADAVRTSIRRAAFAIVAAVTALVCAAAAVLALIL